MHLGKLLAFVLRHRPDAAGVTLDAGGWVDVDELVAGLRRTGHRVDADDVRRTVAADPKGRYQLVEGRIRATQGHSVDLSEDVRTAEAVGRRRGEPVVLVVDAAGLHAAGQLFRRASNGVWLTDEIPPAFVRRLENRSV